MNTCVFFPRERQGARLGEGSWARGERFVDTVARALAGETG